MDWNLAIDINREALKRILAALVAMAGLGGASTSPSTGAGPCASSPFGSSRPLDAFRHAAGMTDFGQSPKPAFLPRHLHRAVLRLLRPAEAAARRLVIVAARGLAVAPARPHLRKRKANPSLFMRNGIETGIVLPPGVTYPDPAAASPARPRACGFALLDPLRSPLRQRRPRSSGVPRIWAPGCADPISIPVRKSPLPGDPIDAARLGLRLTALGRVLDDLPRAARRFARWRSRVAAGAQKEESRVAAGAQKEESRDVQGGQTKNPASRRRLWPLKPGRPPGARRPGSRRPAHEIDEILDATHGLAFFVLAHPDTS